MCPRMCDGVSAFRGQADLRPRRNHLLHDLNTKMLLRNLQYGITTMGIIDTCVFAHYQHRRTSENPGNLGDCMKGRIRFMTTVIPTCDHACRVTCLTKQWTATVQHNFRSPKPRARYPHLPNARSYTR